MEVLSLCPFRAGALIWQAAPSAWSLTVIVKATFTIVPSEEAALAALQEPVAAVGAGSVGAQEDLAPLKPRVDVLTIGAEDEDDALVDIGGALLGGRGPIPPLAPARRLLLDDKAFAWASLVLTGAATNAGPPPEGFDFGFFQTAPRSQQIDLLRIAAPLTLKKVIQGQDRVETKLPPRRPQAFRVDPKSGRVTEIALRCDTLCIDATQSSLLLTFRGLADLKSGDEADVGKIVIAAHELGKRIRAERVDRFLRSGEPLEDEQGSGKSMLEMRHDAVLVSPKAGDTLALPEMMAVPEVPPLPPKSHSTPQSPESASIQKRARQGTLQLPPGQSDSGVLAGFGSALPFRQAEPNRAAPPPPAQAPQTGESRRHDTMELPPAGEISSGFFLPPNVVATRPPPLEETTADLPNAAEQGATKEHADEIENEETTVDLSASEVNARYGTEAFKSKLPERPIPAPPGLAKPPLVKPEPSAKVPPKPALVKPGPEKPGPEKPAAPKPAAIATPAPLAPKPQLKIPAPLGPRLGKPGQSTPPPPLATTPPKPATIPPKPATVLPAKPALLGGPGQRLGATPLGKPAPASAPAPEPDPTPAPALAAAPASTPASARPAPTDALDAASVMTLERCAAIAAELRHRAAERKTILEREQLSEDVWTAVEKHWAESIARETERGARRLLAAYDASYVATQVRLGLRMGLQEHARLQVASERGTTAKVLSELGLEPADQMRLGRVWTQRLVDEPARMAELSAAIDAERSA